MAGLFLILAVFRDAGHADEAASQYSQPWRRSYAPCRNFTALPCSRSTHASPQVDRHDEWSAIQLTPVEIAYGHFGYTARQTRGLLLGCFEIQR